MSNTCSHCHQNLYPVHPIEVKRAIQLLVALSKNPKKMMDKYQSLSNLLSGSGNTWRAVAYNAFIEAATRIEPDRAKWHYESNKEEYNLAAQILSDGWLPVGHILDKKKKIEDCSHYQTEELIPDPNGNISVVTVGKPAVQCRRVVTHIPESDEWPTIFQKLKDEGKI